MQAINLKVLLVTACCFAVLITLSVNAQDQDMEEEHSLVSTGLRANASSYAQIDENAQEDNSELAGVVFDQLVTQPCRSLLRTVEAFGKFAYQNPAMALAITATYVLPVVAALDERTTSLWYPQYACVRTMDIMQVTTWVGSESVTVNWVAGDKVAQYQFTPYTSGSGYATYIECSNKTWGNWIYPHPATSSYYDYGCTIIAPISSNAYQWAKPGWGWWRDGKTTLPIVVSASNCVNAPKP